MPDGHFDTMEDLDNEASDEDHTESKPPKLPRKFMCICVCVSVMQCLMIGYHACTARPRRRRARIEIEYETEEAGAAPQTMNAISSSF